MVNGQIYTLSSLFQSRTDMHVCFLIIFPPPSTFPSPPSACKDGASESEVY